MIKVPKHKILHHQCGKNKIHGRVYTVHTIKMISKCILLDAKEEPVNVTFRYQVSHAHFMHWNPHVEYFPVALRTK